MSPSTSLLHYFPVYPPAGAQMAVGVTVPASDIPLIDAAAASGGWYAPSNTPGDHINMALVARYHVT